MDMAIPESKKIYREQNVFSRDNTYIAPKRLFTSDFK